jgi:hypothetical protein
MKCAGEAFRFGRVLSLTRSLHALFVSDGDSNGKAITHLMSDKLQFVADLRQAQLTTCPADFSLSLIFPTSDLLRIRQTEVCRTLAIQLA